MAYNFLDRFGYDMGDTHKYKISSLTSGRLMAKNTILNLAGQLSSVLGALIAVPFLIHGLGSERFGVLTIIWLVVGYFSLFDFGMGSATAKLVAEKLGAQREGEVFPVVRSAMILLGILGTVGTVVVLLLAPWIVRSMLKIPVWLQPETLRSLYLLAFAIPLVILTACFRGVLEAYQRFDLVNMIRIPLGLLAYFGPLLVLQFSPDLFYVTGVLVVIRALTLAIHGMQCRRVIPSFEGVYRFNNNIRPLLTYGSWVTVSSIVGPVLVYFDRFVIGSMVSVAAVAYYAISFEISTKLWILVGALVGVLFPAFAATVNHERHLTARIFSRGTACLFLALFPVFLIGIALAHEGLELWLGLEFADNSYRIMQVLIVGVFINSFAQIAFALVQGSGRPDVTAKAHLVELPFYLLSLWWLVKTYGVLGASFAWLLRIIIDSAFLFYFAGRLLPECVEAVKKIVVAAVITILFAVIIEQIHPLTVKITCIVGIMMLIGISAWTVLVQKDDRTAMQKRVIAFLRF